ncbi:MAG: hypothetical protein HZB38_01800 [Planctomycetes bacterium]|nr:hypothetical protein [Planctomycetota bacterium]
MVTATQGVGATPATSIKTDRGLGALKSEDFFKILITELRQQDPLQPAKTSDMISNVSQIRSIELSGQLTETLDTLARQQRTAGTSELIGKYVVAVTGGADGAPTVAEGMVSGVRFDASGTALLELDSGVTVAASNVAHVTTLEEAERRMSAAGQDQLATVLSAGDLNGGAASASAKSRANARKTDFFSRVFHL